MNHGEITEAEFHAYETVRLSGLTNMYAILAVSELSGLSLDTIKAIHRANYAVLRAKYGVPKRVELMAEELRAEYA